MRQYVYDYIRNTNILDDADDIDFSDKAFAYDYNEIQELFFDERENNFVILAGKTGLRKKDMVGRIFNDLLLRGVTSSDIVYLDYECPLIKESDPNEIISFFIKERSESSILYLLINEIQEIDDWFNFLAHLRADYTQLKILSTSSTPSYIYEKMYDTGCTYCKIVVLSEKNDSNIKFETTTFGIYKEFKYNIKNGLVEIKGLTKEGKKMPSHHIPSEIDGYPVRIIASGAFHDRKEMTEIEIPESILMIGDYAFSKCSGLKSIKLPSKLRHIGDHSFLGATNLTGIEGGENIEHIGNSAFYGTGWLDIQGEFAILGKVLYKYRGDSRDITVPSYVDTLASYSFSESPVVTVTLSKSVDLGEGVFYKCRSLKTINLVSDCIPAFTFYQCENLEYPCDLNKAGKFAFYSCTSLKKVKVNIADECSFTDCNNLKNVTVGDTASMGSFWNCHSLSQVDLNTTKHIGDCAFGRTDVDSIETGAESIGSYAFEGCCSLRKISLGKTPVIGKTILFGCESVSEMSVPGEYKIMWYFGKHPEKLTILQVDGNVCDDFCRNCQSLEHLILKNIQKFGRWSFYNDSSLSIIEIENVKTIGDWAFAYCNSIETVTLPESVEHIGMNTFRYCNNLKTIKLESEDVVIFGANAFYSTHPSKSFIVKDSLIKRYIETKIWAEYRDSFKPMSI